MIHCIVYTEKFKVKMVYDRVESLKNAVKLECKIINFMFFSKIAAGAASDLIY